MSNGYNANVRANYVHYGTMPSGGVIPQVPAAQAVPPQMNVSHNTYHTTVQQPPAAQQAPAQQQPSPKITPQPENDSFIKSDAAAVTIGSIVSLAALLMCVFAPAKAPKAAKQGFFAKLKAKRDANPIRAAKKAAKQKIRETKQKAKLERQEAIQKNKLQILESKANIEQEILEAKLKAKQEKLEKKLKKKLDKLNNNNT